MHSNKFWAAVSKVLAAVTVTLITVLLLVPGAGAASKYKVLHKFTGADGGDSEANLIFDSSGNLYGATAGGGAYGGGTVFKLSPNLDGSWTESILYSFAGGSDPYGVRAGVIFDASGALYGTSVNGGDYGSGTVFRLTPNPDGTWTESVLYSFTGGGDGYGPVGGLIFDDAGNLYGTAIGGGSVGGGVVFELIPNSDGSWTESVLHSFTGKDAGYPDHSNLVFDSAGNLYGAASDLNWGPCCGTIFELIPQTDGSWKEKILHRFTGGKDGGTPESTLIFDQAGNLYGTALRGGTYAYGVVFKLTLGSDGKWREHVLHHFKSGKDGDTPLAGLVFDPAGNLYGTTYKGGVGECSGTFGSQGCGTVFKLTPNSHGGWTKQVLRRFQGKPNGNPYRELLLDGLGNLYGITSGDGTGGYGGVFEITP